MRDTFLHSRYRATKKRQRTAILTEADIEFFVLPWKATNTETMATRWSYIFYYICTDQDLQQEHLREIKSGNYPAYAPTFDDDVPFEKSLTSPFVIACLYPRALPPEVFELLRPDKFNMTLDDATSLISECATYRMLSKPCFENLSHLVRTFDPHTSFKTLSTLIPPSLLAYMDLRFVFGNEYVEKVMDEYKRIATLLTFTGDTMPLQKRLTELSSDADSQEPHQLNEQQTTALESFVDELHTLEEYVDILCKNRRLTPQTRVAVKQMRRYATKVVRAERGMGVRLPPKKRFTQTTLQGTVLTEAEEALFAERETQIMDTLRREDEEEADRFMQLQLAAARGELESEGEEEGEGEEESEGEEEEN